MMPTEDKLFEVIGTAMRLADHEYDGGNRRSYNMTRTQYVGKAALNALLESLPTAEMTWNDPSTEKDVTGYCAEWGGEYYKQLLEMKK